MERLDYRITFTYKIYCYTCIILKLLPFLKYTFASYTCELNAKYAHLAFNIAIDVI